MSHTTQVGRTIFIHDGDYNGMVCLGLANEKNNDRVEVPISDIYGFAIHIMRRECEKVIANMSGQEVIALHSQLLTQEQLWKRSQCG
jgi:hypothetical protein